MPFPLTARKATREPGPLDADAWLNAALHVLASSGVEAVRVERLAKSLGITKGSFYWHFKDRLGLLEAMLLSWRQRATLRVIDRLERRSVSAADRLKQLLALTRVNSPTAHDRADIEAAIRLWGRSDAKVASAILEIDRLRLGYIKSLIESTNISGAESAARAVLIYAFMLAEASVGAAIDPETCALCEKLLLTWSKPTGEKIRARPRNKRK
jgi:AcrR family transcriptional regulator